MIKQLAHICIHSADLEATLRFYQQGLGLEKGFDFIREEKLFGFYLKFGENTFIEVFAGDPGREGSIGHFAVEVTSIDEVLRKVAAAGYPVGEKSMGADHSWQAWLTDPNGVRIELHEYTAESLQLRGGRCVVNW